MLDRDKHQLVLKQLLREVFSDNELSAQLVFKGGTALMLFHGLKRFSTDLDFDIRSSAGDIDFARLSKLVARQLTIRDAAIKENTYLLEGSYGQGMQQIKIEVSRRTFPQRIALYDFLGMSVPLLSNEYLLAHKLCALTSRKVLQNRDIYDADFMLKKNWEPNAEIVLLRTGMSVREYYEVLLRTMDMKTTSSNIMLGLGEVLDQEERMWARENLLKSFKEQLLLRV